MYSQLSGLRHIFTSWRRRPESRTTLYSEEIRQVSVPVGRPTTATFGRVHRNAALRAKFANYDLCVVTDVFAADVDAYRACQTSSVQES